jgi:uncharacterized membrane protein
MKPLIVLVSVFVLSLFGIKIINGNYDYKLAAQISMSAMLLFTSIAHFAFAEGMTMMLPGFIPFKKQIVYVTGIMEIAAAVCLLIPSTKIITGWLLIAFFVALLPANLYAAIRHIDYQKGTFDGKGINYLWFRIPLQLFFIAWIYFSVLA